MQGQKQIFTFIVILIVICSFTFFRNGIRKDKQFRRIREEALRKKLGSNWEYNEEITDSVDEPISLQDKSSESYLYKLLEYKDVCYDLHALIFKPEKEVNSNEMFDLHSGGKYGKTNFNRKIDDHSQDTVSQILDTKQKNSVVTGPVIYLFIIILIYSFIKAATDISKQLGKKANSDDQNCRRYSLQEYANKKNRRLSKGPVLKRATTIAMEPRLSVKQKSLEERRKSYMLPEFTSSSGLVTEPGTPPKVLNGLASRPAPLLRRCSVPVFAVQQPGHNSVLRRPSIDSFSEDDSSPDVKRRVRMIHRH